MSDVDDFFIGGALEEEEGIPPPTSPGGADAAPHQSSTQVDLAVAAALKATKEKRVMALNETILLDKDIGLPQLAEMCKSWRFDSTNDEENLDMLLFRLEGFAHRMFPRLPFDEVIESMERLSGKTSVKGWLRRERRKICGLPDEEEEVAGIADEPVLESRSQEDDGHVSTGDMPANEITTDITVSQFDGDNDMNDAQIDELLAELDDF